MFKIRLAQNKEVIVAALMVVLIVVLMIVNAVILIPQVISIFSPSQETNNKTPIDTETVNQAIDILSK